MRKEVTITLTLLEADAILQQLNRNLEGIMKIEKKRGHITPTEHRLFRAVEKFSKQAELSDLETRHVDTVIQAHEDMFNKPNQN